MDRPVREIRHRHRPDGEGMRLVRLRRPAVRRAWKTGRPDLMSLNEMTGLTCTAWLRPSRRNLQAVSTPAAEPQTIRIPDQILPASIEHDLAHAGACRHADAERAAQPVLTHALSRVVELIENCLDSEQMRRNCWPPLIVRDTLRGPWRSASCRRAWRWQGTSLRRAWRRWLSVTCGSSNRPLTAALSRFTCRRTLASRAVS